MVKQLLLPLAGVAIFIIVAGLFTQRSGQFNLAKYLHSSSPAITKTMTIGTKTIQVEIANTQDSRAKGLGGRNTLDPDTGMLFVFDSKQVSPIFWMKDMLIPLDIIWVSNNKIVKIDKKIPAPAPGTSDNNLPKYAGGTVDYVLEVQSGFSDTNGIKVGDLVTLPSGL